MLNHCCRDMTVGSKYIYPPAMGYWFHVPITMSELDLEHHVFLFISVPGVLVKKPSLPIHTELASSDSQSNNNLPCVFQSGVGKLRAFDKSPFNSKSYIHGRS